MPRSEYDGMRYDDPRAQAEFERLLAEVRAAEQSREPIQQRHREAERNMDIGSVSDSEYRSVDSQYIAANNKIAAAKKKVNEFLARNKDYRVDR